MSHRRTPIPAARADPAEPGDATRSPSRRPSPTELFRQAVLLAVLVAVAAVAAPLRAQDLPHDPRSGHERLAAPP